MSSRWPNVVRKLGILLNVCSWQLSLRSYALISSPIETEEWLLSLLVNTRKALDCEPGIAGISTLRFHCEWMVHHALSGRRVAKLIAIRM